MISCLAVEAKIPLSARGKEENANNSLLQRHMSDSETSFIYSLETCSFGEGCDKQRQWQERVSRNGALHNLPCVIRRDEREGQEAQASIDSAILVVFRASAAIEDFSTNHGRTYP